MIARFSRYGMTREYVQSLRLTAATLIVMSVIVGTAISLDIFVRFTPQWDIALAKSGPTPVNCLSGSVCQTYYWTIATVTILSNADRSIPEHAAICAYTNLSGDTVAVTPRTTVRSILTAPQLYLQVKDTCPLRRPVVLAQGDLSTQIIASIIALLTTGAVVVIIIHATQRQYVTHVVALLGTIIITFAIQPASYIWVQGGQLIFIVGEFIGPPLLMTLLWRLLIAPTSTVRWQRIARITTVAVWLGCGLGLLSYAVAVQMQTYQSVIVVRWFEILLLAFNNVTALGILLYRLFHYDPVRSSYARVLAVGVVIAILPVLMISLIPLLTYQQLIVERSIAAVTVIALPLAIIYVVLKRDLFNADTRIHRTTTTGLYGVLTGIATFCVLSLLANWGAISIVAAEVLFVPMTLIAFFSPLLLRGASLVTALVIFPEIHRYQSYLQRPLATAENIARPEDIANVLLAAIKLQMPIRTAALFVANRQTGEFVRIRDNEAQVDPLLRFPANHFLPQCLRSYRMYTLAELRNEAQARLSISDSEWQIAMADVAPAELFIPMKLKDRLIAFLTVGPRADEFPYTATDRSFLLTLANRQALTLDYARVVEDLEAANEHQHELDRRKDTFIAITHHELRTPLAGLMGYLEFLQTMDHEERHRQPEQVDYLVNAAVVLVNELHSLMTSLRVADDQFNNAAQMQLQIINVITELRFVTSTVDMAFDRSHPRITITCDEKLTVWADASNVRRILINLLSNALKYSPEQAPIVLGAVLQPDTNMVEFTVRDYGDGIAPDEQEHIYESFYRLKQHALSNIGGTGLGLYVTHALVARMNGNLWVASTGITGEGSTFHFTLPAAPPPDK